MKKLLIILSLGLLMSSCNTDDNNTSPSISNPSGSSVQCSGITQSGNRCQRKTTNISGKCWQHE